VKFEDYHLHGKWSRRALLRLIGGAGLAAVGGLFYWLKSFQTTARPILPTRLNILTRKEWGAREPNHEAPDEYGFASRPTEPEWYIYPGDLADIYQTIAIHHSASLLANNETMHSIQDLHMDRNGWADIGYHYGIDKDGLIYEGRDIGSRGSSVAGHNTGTIGVVVMGNFEVDEPLEVQLTALQMLVNALTITYRPTHLAAHSEFNPESLCPGRNMFIHLDALAQNAGLQRGTKGYIPPT
jgi:N-acetylmuramoyl-L-alanine amidase